MLDIKDNSIIILPNSIKNNVIKDVRTKGLYNIKFMTLEEVIKKIYFDYNKETIYYLINKYNYKYDVALMYLNNLYYINDIDYNIDKLSKLKNLKQELDNNNLLIYDNLFKYSLKDKEIIIYGYNNLTKYQNKIIDILKEYTKVNIIKKDNNNYKHTTIYKFNNIEEEVSYVAESICNNIDNDIDINNIKIYYNNKDYDNYLDRIFKLYNLPLNNNNSYLYSTSIGRYLIDNLNI